MMSSETSVCVVLPLFRVAEHLPALVEQLEVSLRRYNLRIVGVDDASPDASGEVLVSAARKSKIPCQLLVNPRNRGQHESILLGLKQASADVLVVMDADLQDPPGIAVELVDRLEADQVSLVIACRRDTASPLFESITSAVFKRLLWWGIGSEVPLDIGSFYAMRSSAKEVLMSGPDVDPSLLPLFLVNRVPTAYREYARSARPSGRSGYTFRSRLRYALRVLKNIDTLRS